MTIGAATESPEVASPSALDSESASPELPPSPVSPDSTSVSASASPESPDSPLSPDSPVSASASELLRRCDASHAVVPLQLAAGPQLSPQSPTRRTHRRAAGVARVGVARRDVRVGRGIAGVAGVAAVARRGAGRLDSRVGRRVAGVARLRTAPSPSSRRCPAIARRRSQPRWHRPCRRRSTSPSRRRCRRACEPESRVAFRGSRSRCCDRTRSRTAGSSSPDSALPSRLGVARLAVASGFASRHRSCRCRREWRSE